MKKWYKVFKLSKYDVLLLQMCNQEDGDHIQLILRVPNGQYIRTITFGDDVKKADKYFKEYTKEDAIKFVEQFEEALNESKREEPEAVSKD